MDEKISAVLNKDGGVENCEVQGTMSLQVRCSAVLLFSLGGGEGCEMLRGAGHHELAGAVQRGAVLCSALWSL